MILRLFRRTAVALAFVASPAFAAAPLAPPPTPAVAPQAAATAPHVAPPPTPTSAAPHAVTPQTPTVHAPTPAGVVHAPTTSSTENLRVVLRTAPIAQSEWNQKPGFHPSKFITLQSNGGTVRAIVKGELPEPGYGPTHLREAAASHLAEHLGINAVPATTRRVVDGQPSSVQVLVGGAKSVHDLVKSGQPIPQLQRPVAEKLRIFDYIAGNRDRHGNNLLVRQENGNVEPVAIDNGLTFPEGPVPIVHFAWPTKLAADQTGPLLPETKEFIRTIDPKGVAEVLQKSGISREAAIHTLRRVARVQEDPSFLELESADISSSGEFGAAELPRVAKMAATRDQGLKPEALQRVNEIVDSVYGKPN